MGAVYITDYIDNPNLEYEVLGDFLTSSISDIIEVLLVWHQKIDNEYLDQFPSLKGVVRYGVGYDAIDLKEIEKRGLVFSNTPDYGTDEVSDTALAMTLNILRGVSKYNIDSRSFTGTWQENTITELRRTSEITLGVIGAGRIGTALMLKAKALKLDIIFFDPFKDSGYEKAIGVKRAHSIEELLATADIVSIHTPLTNSTRGMVNDSFISAMKTGASIINTARGEIIEELDVLHKALKAGKLANVALDVLPVEPPPECTFIEAWRKGDPQIVINPHTAYYSIEAYKEMRIKAAENAKRIIDGNEPFNIIIDGRKV